MVAQHLQVPSYSRLNLVYRYTLHISDYLSRVDLSTKSILSFAQLYDVNNNQKSERYKLHNDRKIV